MNPGQALHNKARWAEHRADAAEGGDEVVEGARPDPPEVGLELGEGGAGERRRAERRLQRGCGAASRRIAAAADVMGTG